MPIIQGIKRVSPLDLNKNIKIGVALPLDETNLFRGTETIMEQAKTNLLNLLLTYPGERINLPHFGIGLKNLLFEQQIDLDSLKEKTTNQIERYIPNIKLTKITINQSEDRHTIFISINYKSKLDGSTETIQINFS